MRLDGPQVWRPVGGTQPRGLEGLFYLVDDVSRRILTAQLLRFTGKLVFLVNSLRSWDARNCLTQLEAGGREEPQDNGFRPIKVKTTTRTTR